MTLPSQLDLTALKEWAAYLPSTDILLYLSSNSFIVTPTRVKHTVSQPLTLRSQERSARRKVTGDHVGQ